MEPYFIKTVNEIRFNPMKITRVDKAIFSGIMWMLGLRGYSKRKLRKIEKQNERELNKSDKWLKTKK